MLRLQYDVELFIIITLCVPPGDVMDILSEQLCVPMLSRPEPLPGLQVQDAVQHQTVSLLPGREGM